MRADAQANRTAILDAARELFASKGTDVSFSSVAATAGVGIATLYRHFPTPDALRLGVLEQAFTGIQHLEAPAITAIHDNPETGWREYLKALSALQIGSWLPNIAADVMAQDVDELRMATLNSIDRVLRAAKDVHLVREEISANYFQVAMGVITRPLNTLAEDFAPDHATWLLNVFERGLRP